MVLGASQVDRAAGVLLGVACGDALGAGYEFKAPRVHGETVGMVGGGPYIRPWEIGEWTDDTSMAIAIAEVAAAGVDLRTSAGLDGVAARFAEWAQEANDIGTQTASVLFGVQDDPTGSAASQLAAQRFQQTRSAGNGSLMRTAPVALAYLHDEEALWQAAGAVSGLTHAGPDAIEACQLWTSATAHAVRNGNFDGLRLAVDRLPSHREEYWSALLNHAETVEPHQIAHNGWVVAALQAAWSAIVRTPIPNAGGGHSPAGHFAAATEAAVRAGNDTDTVAAIAGGLLGARWGASAIPLSWRRVLHGWPGLRGRDLVALGVLSARGGSPDASGWPSLPVQQYPGYPFASALAPHPHDADVLLGGVDAARHPSPGVSAVVSLCRLGRREVPAPGVEAENHVEVWLTDRSEPGSNPNLDWVLTQAAATVAAMRQEGHTVLLHCVEARSRTPTVAALYATRHLGVDKDAALRDVLESLPHADPNPAFRDALSRLTTDRP